MNDGSDRLDYWLRQVALYSNDGWLAREARTEYVARTGSEPLADWEIELLRDARPGESA